MEQKSNAFLETEKLGVLMRKYSVPCIISLVVAALLIVELLPRQLIGIFGAANESEYYTLFAVRSFRMYLCMMPLAMVNKGTFIFLQALGKAKESMILSLVREIIFGVFLPILLPLLFALDGILYFLPDGGHPHLHPVPDRDPAHVQRIKC